MQNPIYSVAALTPALLLAGGFNQAAGAQEAPQNLRTQQLYASLQGAVCRNDWNYALRVIGPLMGSPEITQDYHQELIRFRHQLEDWRASKSTITGISGCDRAVGVNRPSSTSNRPTPRTSVNSGPQDVSVQQLYAVLQGAVCRNDWNGALIALGPLIGSANISNDYRIQLIRFRHQLEEWRAASALVEEIPNCRGVAADPGALSPELANHRVDWAS